MTSIDERVVEMRFDNKDFERNAQTSLGTIDKLKRSLNFDESSRSLDGLQNSLKRLSLDDIGNSIDDLKDKVSGTSMLALGFIGRIGSALAEQILGVLNQIKGSLNLEALSGVQNMLAGWGKYAEKTQSVATIMAATGESIDVVSAAMDRLNYFTDETSYDFADMTNNIGKFTANGIALDDASSAMQGIATWAARSGQNAQTASRVMYNLAQAIGMGALKLQDWKSVELANMGTKEFKDVAIQTAVEIGALTKGADGLIRTAKGTAVSIQNFRETLAEGWLDNDVLMATLTEYGKAADLINGIHEATGMTAANTIELAQAAGKGKLSVKDLGRALADLEDPLANDSAHVQEVYEALKVLGSEEYEFSLATYLASQEARTFGDAMKSVADAVSTKWMNTFELIFGNYEMAKETWTDLANNLYDIFTPAIEARNALFKQANKNGAQNLLDYMEKIGLSADDLEDSMKNVTNKYRVDRITKDYESFADALIHGAFSAANTRAAIDDLLKKQTFLGKQVESTSMTFKEFDDLAVRVLRMEFGYLGSERQAALEAVGYTKEQAEAIIDYVWARHELGHELSEADAKKYLDVFKTINRVQDESIELTEEQREELKRLSDQIDMMQFAEYLQQGLMNVGSILVKVADTAREAFRTIVPQATPEQLRNLAQRFADVTGKVNDMLDSEGFKNISSVLIAPFRMFGSVVQGVLKLLGPLANLAWSAVTPVGNVVSVFAEWIGLIHEATGEINPFGTVISKVSEAGATFINFASKVTKQVGEIVGKKLIEKLTDPFWNFVSTLQKFREDKLKSIDEFIDKLKNANVEETAQKIVGKIRDLYRFATSLKESVNFLELFNKASKSLRDKFPAFGKAVDYVTQKIQLLRSAFTINKLLGKNGFESAFNALKTTAKSVIGDITHWLNKLGISSESISSKFENVRKFFSDIKDNAKETFGTAKSTVTSFIESLGITLPKVLKGAALTTAGVGIVGFITKLANAKKEGAGKTVIDNLVSALNPFSDVLEKLKTATSSFNLLNFAIAIGVLAGALIALSYVPSENLAVSLGVLGGALAEFLGVLAVSSKLISGSGAAKLIGIGLGMMAIAGALLLFARVIKKYSTLDFGSTKQIVKVLGVLYLAVDSLRRLAKAAGKSGFRLSSGLGLIATATSLLLFGKVLESYAKLKIGKQNVAKVFSALAAAVISLSTIAFISGKAKFKLSNGLGLISLATSMLILAKVIGSLGKYPPSQLSQGMRAIGTLAAIVTGMMVFIAGVTSFTNIGNGIAGVLLLTGITTTMLGFAGAVALLGNLKNEQLEKARGTIIFLTLIISALTAFVAGTVKVIGLKKAAGSLLLLTGIVLALVAFAAVVAILGVIAIPTLAGCAALLAILGVLAATFALINHIDMLKLNTKNVLATLGEIALLGLALLPLVVVLEKLSKIKASDVLPGLKLIGWILGGFLVAAASIGILSAAFGPMMAIGMGVLFVGLLAFVGSIALLVYELEKLSTVNLDRARDGIQAVKEEIGILTDLAKQFMSTKGLFGASIEASITAWTFGIGLNKLANDAQILGLVNAEQAKAGLTAVQEEIDLMFRLGERLAADEDAFSKGDKASLMAFDFGIGLWPLVSDTRILGLTNAEAATAAMVPLNGLIDTMVELANKLGSDSTLFSKAEVVGDSMWQFGIGLLPIALSEYLAGLTDAANAAENMKSVGTLIEQLFTIANTMGEDEALYHHAEKVAFAVQDFGIALRELILDEFLSSFVNVDASTAGFEVTKEIIQYLVDTANIFGEDPHLFTNAHTVATACSRFAVALAGLSFDSILNMIVGADKEGSLAGFEIAKTMIQYLIDTAGVFGSDPSIFTNATKVSTAAKQFAGALSQLTVSEFIAQFVDSGSAKESIENVKAMIDMLVEAATSFQDEGMFESATSASEACVKFASSLKKLTRAENKISKVDAEDAVAGLTPIQSIISMLIESAEAFAGNENLAEGASDAMEAMEEFAVKLQGIAREVKKIGGGDVDSSSVTTIITSISDSLIGVAAVGDQLQTANATLDALSNFITSISSLGSTDWKGNVSFDSEGITSTISAIIKSIGDLQKALRELDTENVTLDSSSVTDYTSAITELTDTKDVVSEFASDVSEAMSTVTTDMGTKGTEAADSFNKSLANKTSTVKQTATNLSKSALTGVQSQVPAFSTVGTTMGSNLANGLLSQAGPAQDAGHTVARSAYRGTLGYYTEFYHTGENMMQGLIDGLYAKRGEVEDAASSLANAVIKYFNFTVQVKSPSRVFMQIGRYIDEGLAIGIEESTPVVTDAVAFMANNLNIAAQSIADRINGILEDPDSQPTITPVLDLTTLRGQAGAIDSIVTANRTMALSGRIAGQMDYNQNGGIQNVVALDPVTIAEITSSQPDININFEGSLAQLARILQPAIVDETNRLGPNLVNE